MRAEHFAWYLWGRKGMLRKLEVSVGIVWDHNDYPMTQRGYWQRTLHPSRLWFYSEVVGEDGKEVQKPVLLTCIHVATFRCRWCTDLKQGESVKEEFPFWRVRSRIGCILWNKGEDTWV